jgi:hypothetical protein
MSIGEMWRSMSEWLVRFRQRHAYQQMDTQYHQNISARSAVPIDAHLMEMQVIFFDAAWLLGEIVASCFL